jgi:hypothetical protein
MYNISTYLKEGKSKEIEFAELFDLYELSNKLQDIYEHWDVNISGKKIDVKGLKKTNRANKDVDENIHWIEIKGITGKLGWLYGDADYFAFETIDYWVLVDKLKLQDYIKTKTIKEYTSYPTINKLYSRKDRSDVLTLVKTLDLCYISEVIINKNKNHGKT